MKIKEVANPGSAIGEALGTLLESEIHRILEPLAKEKGCIYITTGQLNPKTGKSTKLILKDIDDIEYNIDSVIINNRFQPLVLIESKYIRYKKHNRDKASWICTAHSKLRQRYVSIRKSIAILMGSWSKPSKRLLESFEVELIEISFDDICDILAIRGVEYRWGEKDRAQAMESWNKFCQLSGIECQKIARELISKIVKVLKETITAAVDENIPRKIRSVSVVVKANTGETFTYKFSKLKQALSFMKSYKAEKELDIKSAPSLLMGNEKDKPQLILFSEKK